MSKRRISIAIAILTLVIALTILSAHAMLVPTTYGVPPGDTNAPAPLSDGGPTQAQKDEALKIAATSPLCQQYNTYPDESWSCGWDGYVTDSKGNLETPDDGHTVAVFKELPNYDEIHIDVDLNTGKILSQAIWQPYDTPTPMGVGEYGSPFSTSDDISLPSTFSSIPSINTGSSDSQLPFQSYTTLPDNQITIGKMPGQYGTYANPPSNLSLDSYPSPALLARNFAGISYPFSNTQDATNSQSAIIALPWLGPT